MGEALHQSHGTHPEEGVTEPQGPKKRSQDQKTINRKHGTKRTRQTRQRTRPAHRLHSGDGGYINPTPDGKIIEHKQHRQRDKGMGAPRADPCARRDKCGACRPSQTVASSQNIDAQAPMKDDGETSRIPQPRHAPYRTLRATTGKNHLKPQLSPQQSPEITCRSVRPNPTQPHGLRLPITKNTREAGGGRQRKYPTYISHITQHPSPLPPSALYGPEPGQHGSILPPLSTNHRRHKTAHAGPTQHKHTEPDNRQHIPPVGPKAARGSPTP
jgi:hypothetical protein